MDLDADAAYRALAARDARFDGHWFVGVTTTGVYCRPVCRVRTPRRENCRFFASAAQAEAAAFRPCLKCRPEIAPGAGLAWTTMDASRTLARQAAALLDEHAAQGDAPGLAALAARLGVSDRHLRRIFAAEHGVTPLQYLQTRRLLLAKQLLTDSTLPVAQVALASGFRSLRRFNDAFARDYRMSPSRLRARAADGADATAARGQATPDVRVTLAYREPCDVEALLRFIALRAIPGIEQVEGRGVRRSLRAGTVGDADGWLEVRFDQGPGRVELRYAAGLAASSARLVGAVRRWLDLDATPQRIDAALHELPGAPGLRLPGGPDAFELAVRAVLGQQVTVAAARTLAHRLVERFGTPLATPWAGVDRVFPSPAALAAAPADALGALGILRTRSAAIVALAAHWPALQAQVDRREPAPLVEALCALPGIGPWTAHYVAMRALGWPDAWLPGDVAVLKAMHHLFDTSNDRAASQRAAAWQPWRSYAVLRLWNSLEGRAP